MSVSGNALVDQYYMEQKFSEKIDFRENSFYIGQSLENVYIRSKFEAERKILDAILQGTDAYILRVGNLMPRMSDGKFQENVSENAYISRLKAFIKLGKIPEYLKDDYLEFTPIDYTATAIMKIVKYTNKNNRIYHIFNNNHVFVKDILKFVKDIEIVDNESFKEKLKKTLRSENSDFANLLLNDLDKNLNLNYNSNIKIKSEHTVKLLEKYKFYWPSINSKYIGYVLELIKGE